MELRDRIVEEASVLFFRNGVKSMTMSDIANELGISKRTLYEVFQDKEELLEECINAHTRNIDRKMEELIQCSENVVDALMQIYSKHLHQAHEVNKSVLHDLKKYYAPIYKKIESNQRKRNCIFIPLMEKGIKQGLIREDTNFEVVLWLVEAQFKALVDNESYPANKYSDKEFINTIILNFIRGIATPLGVAQIDQMVETIRQEKIKKETTK
jgi:AcrR family transcriptional regulator